MDTYDNSNMKIIENAYGKILSCFKTYTEKIICFYQSKEEKEDPYEKLAKLKKLLDQGIISQEEFDEAKKKLLNL